MFDKITATGIVYSSGQHNAFPSVCRFGESLYVAFRTGKGHLFFDGVIKILRSDNEGATWQEVRDFSADGDLRDPRLLVLDGKLHLYSGMRNPDRTSAKRLETRHWISADGSNFEEVPLSGLQENTFFWGFAAYKGKIVGTGYCVNGSAATEASLYTGTDGIHWEHDRCLDVPGGNEVSLDFDKNGVLHGFIRCETPPQHPVYFTLAPDGDIQYKQLSVPMQGIMLKCVGEDFLVACRRWDGAERSNLRCDCFRYTRNGELTLLGKFPSAGDCSYAVCVERKDGKLLVIYYSSHNHWHKRGEITDPEHGLPADICFVVLE